GHPVLEPGERPPTGVVVRGALGLPAGPNGDPERDRHEQREQHQSQYPRAHEPTSLRSAPARSTSARILSATGSSLLPAYRAYSQARTNVEANWSSPNTSATLMLPTILWL